MIEISKQEKLSMQSNNTGYWLYEIGENSLMWRCCLENDIMCMDVDKLDDLRQYGSIDSIKLNIQKSYGKNDSASMNDSLDLWSFINEINIGDIIYVKDYEASIVGRGIVKSEYILDGRYKKYYHTRKVKWTYFGDWDNPLDISINSSRHLIKIEYQDSLEELFVDKDWNNNKQYWWLVAKPKIWEDDVLMIKKNDCEFYADHVNYTLLTKEGGHRRLQSSFINAKQGDLVVLYCSSPIKKIVALYIVDKENDGKKVGFRRIKTFDNPIDFDLLRPSLELSNMSFVKAPQGSFFDITEQEYLFMVKGISDNKLDADVSIVDEVRETNSITYQNCTNEFYDKIKFLVEVYMSADNYDSLRCLLEKKKNIILQGAPGVGKTFAAKRLAYSIMGEKNNDRIEFIQFHQNYSYEDFMMGYKPTEEGGFVLKEGVFYNFCQKARGDIEHDYFFIIDEINRGNLSKIFGEVMMLMENDYRDESVKLVYRDELFSIPRNVYIIGMMNTADRSLAMMDYALRRRFSFFEMQPAFESEGFRKYQEKLNCKVFDDVIGGIVDLNKKIADDDSLGKGFCIGHSYFCNQDVVDIKWLRNVIKYDIEPMLCEYWFDDDNKYQSEIENLNKLF